MSCSMWTKFLQLPFKVFNLKQKMAIILLGLISIDDIYLQTSVALALFTTSMEKCRVEEGQC